MVRCAFVILSRGIGNQPVLGGAPNLVITGPLLSLRPRTIPTDFSFSVSMGLTDVDITQTPPETLTLRITDPEGRDVLPAVSIALQGPPSGQPEALTEAVLSLSLTNVHLSREGLYRFSVQTMGNEIGYQEIPVMAQRSVSHDAH